VTMPTPSTYNPGNLVRYRDREWMVLPSDDPELLLLKPLGGSDHEITAVFTPMELPGESVDEASFAKPTVDSLGDFATARLLFDAARLSFRNANGPCRCMGKLSFRPRSYQVVPLVMALKLDVVRMLIADDVGIGKTVEALIILKELMERGDVQRFAVICPPHLCDQWQGELKDKLDIEAEIIRSSTVAALERKIHDDRSVFYHFPYQVISIDYIKSDKKKDRFMIDCPEMIIVDEAHTCAKPEFAKSHAQQQRHDLVYQLSKNPGRHILLLTATPHSGKNPEFFSLLGLLKADFEKYQLETITDPQKRELANFFIQRKRENIRKWLHEETPFPARHASEPEYHLSPEYANLYEQALKFARGLTLSITEKKGSKARYWAALALLRGVMSSPAAGYEMLRKKQGKPKEDAEIPEDAENPNLEKLESESDIEPSDLLDLAGLDRTEKQQLEILENRIKELQDLKYDWKAKKALQDVHQWLKEGFHPIIFCRFIATAKYLGQILKDNLPKKYSVRVITSEFSDEQRKEEVELLGREDFRVLVATDCLSEGINLQMHFTAVMHYDLPWNPNRIEQREGRVDRYGQQSELIKTELLWGKDNPIDAVVLNILIKKIREIQKSIGVSIPIGDDNKSIMDAVLKAILLDPRTAHTSAIQGSLFGDEDIAMAERTIKSELEAAKEKALQLRSIFAHSSVSSEEIEAQLKEVDEAIGDVKSVEYFVTGSLRHLGAAVKFDGTAYLMNLTNLPPHLKDQFPDPTNVKVSFVSPTPRGYRYIGRNHLFVELLCQFMLSLAFSLDHDYHRVARTAVIRTDAVKIKTTLIQFRVRNVIKEVKSAREVISEEMYLWGYEGADPAGPKLSYESARKLLQEAQSIENLSSQFQEDTVERELSHFKAMEPEFLRLAENRAEMLLAAHSRFKNLVGGRRYEKVYPVLPPDVMGIYILVPKPAII